MRACRLSAQPAGLFAALLAYLQAPGVRLVAVSKTKPPEMVRELYDAGLYHFGENYVRARARTYAWGGARVHERR